MDKDKQPIEDVDVEWTSTDSSDSSSDDELVSTMRRSRLEHEYHQSRRGAETILTEDDLSDIRGRFGFPNEVQFRLPFKDERADTVSEGWICMYTIYFECGLRLQLQPLLIQCMHHYQLAIPQLMPNGMRVFLGLIVLAEEAGVELSVDDTLAIFYPQENFKDHGRYSMYPRRKKQVVGEMKNAGRYWQDRYFFMHVNEKSMGNLANAFYRLWGTIRKELKKPPPKALLFEEKLEKLLAMPNREWDEIHTFERFRPSSLWKSFIELPTGIAKRVPSWVDWPFIVRGALRRLFDPPLFIEPFTDEEKEAEKAAAAAANIHQVNEPTPFPVLESSPEPPPKPSSPPTKKMKVVEKAKKKVPANKNKRSKVATPELDVERPKGPLLGHMDDLLWDGLKTNIRAMGLIKRTNDKNLEQRTRIRELEAINKNLEERYRRRGEMLLDIERKFADVKTSADRLTATFKEIMHEAKEGTSMMEVMVDRFDEAQAKIKSLKTEKAVLATQILDAFEKATIKARYDLLKQYKQGLFVDAEIEEELDLWKDEFKGPSSAPAITIEPTSNHTGKSGVEPPAHKELLEDREQRQ
ncbi:hypothetical protein TIFTF001_024953 [Ficus carica]|uniref:Transposase (putative) gypsy type domain-containing protein n=1 Tax=Ficus carica TaxID=3494 RepID=A0AA88AP65_FICCA|nr:hypothetical protein TIFTF001_024953 [Ficus carica]